jgi:hypothetical protein
MTGAGLGTAATGDGVGGATVTGAASWANASDELPMSAAMMAYFLAMRIDCAFVIFNLLSVWTGIKRFVADIGHVSPDVPCGCDGEPSGTSAGSFGVHASGPDFGNDILS